MNRAQTLSVTEFFNECYADDIVIADTRSPKEYNHAHIPSAINIPLLDDEQRTEVGTIYKKEGHDAAVLKGFDLVGKNFGDMIRKVKTEFPGKRLYLYCWRGGMRSSIMCWVLNTGRIETTRLIGGYKSYRQWVLQQLLIEKKLIVVGGKTGSGKTEMLKHLADHGEQTIDLEALACHKGSAFGSMGQKPQPTNEQFENNLAQLWEKQKSNEITWIENESRNIGTVKVPDFIYDLIRKAPVADMQVSLETRAVRIMQEYAGFPKEELIFHTKRIEQRLGNQRMKQSIEHLESNERTEWVKMMLEYYDKQYAYSNALREPSKLFPVEMKMQNPKEEVEKFLALRDKIYSEQQTVNPKP